MSPCQCEQTPLNLSEQNRQQLAEAFKALGHPVRIQLLASLFEGSKCVCELHAGHQRELATISSHLSILRRAGLVTSKQQGKNVIYSLACPCVKEIFGYMLNMLKID